MNNGIRIMVIEFDNKIGIPGCTKTKKKNINNNPKMQKTTIL
jgi:hypothetical protein